MSKKIYVGRISVNTTEEQLMKHFSKVGRTISVQIVQGINPNQHSGYGYVVMGSEQETKNAISKLNNSDLDGTRLIVKEAHFLDQDKKPYYYHRNR